MGKIIGLDLSLIPQLINTLRVDGKRKIACRVTSPHATMEPAGNICHVLAIISRRFLASAHCKNETLNFFCMVGFAKDV